MVANQMGSGVTTMQQTTPQQREVTELPRRGFLAGILATLVMAAIMAGLRFTTFTPSLAENLAEGLVGLMPAAVFSSVLDTLQKAAQPALYVGILIGMLAVGGLLGRGFSYGPPTWMRALKLAAALWAAFGIVILPLLGVGLFGSGIRGGLFVQMVELAVVFGGYAAALVLILRALDPATVAAEATGAARPLDEVARQQRRVAVAGIVGGL